MNTYLIVFENNNINPIKITINNNINRPNNPDNDEIIARYVLDNYGYIDYNSYVLDDLDEINMV